MTAIRTIRCDGCGENIAGNQQRMYIEMKEPDLLNGPRELIGVKHFHNLACAHRYTSARVEADAKNAARRQAQT